MISVMNDFGFKRKSDSSAIAIADFLFSGTENPQEVARVGDGGYGVAFPEPRVSSEIDMAEKFTDLESRFYGNVEQGVPRSLEEEARMNIDAGEDDMVSLAEDNRVSFVDPCICMHGFRVGDMVWGKVKSHPWWPGHIFNEAFASASVRRTKREEHVLVAFFGDSSYGWFDPAELIPFEPHFPEKSRQTTSRTFVRSVEEAVDEASRRGALAVACRCRNLHNFRPTSVPGYFSVDVVGYEPGGIYSSKQIKEARDCFIPVELVSFVQHLALASLNRDRNNIEWIQSKAKLLAYRKAVFEEFDETYAQAFGVQPVRPPPNSAGFLDQPDRFAPRVAPLSGPLVVAEALGERRSSAKQATNKTPGKIAKKNKFLLKRRYDTPVAVADISSLPDLPSEPPSRHHGVFPSLPDSNELPASDLDSNYVLQKREKLPPPLPAVAPEPYGDWKPRAETLFPPDYLAKPEPVEVKNERGSSEFMVPMTSAQAQVLRAEDSMAVMKEEKLLKRPREDLHNRGEVNRKKKKKSDLDSDQIAAFMDGDHHRAAASRLAGTGVVPGLVLQDEAINMELPPGLDLTSMELPQLLDDLSSIALDPFYAIERDAPSIIRHIFLRFRSLVYQKSLVLPAASEPAAPIQASSAVIVPLSSEGREIPSALKDGRDQREPFSLSSKPPKPSSKSSDPGKPRKHGPSDLPVEVMAKKKRQMQRLKALASVKKAAISQKNSEIQKQPKDQKDMATKIGTEGTKKQDPPQPKVPSLTYLVMKFPPRSTLPSISNLKARFARFGPLDQSATRVYWKSYSCKVLFKYKADAQSAYDFVQNNNLFGQFKVDCLLRDLEVVGQEKPADPSKRPFESSCPENPVQIHPGGAVLQRASSFSQVPQNPVLLKSILKKPGSDESGYNGSASAGGNVRESPRVKFLLNSDDSRNETQPKAVVSSSNGGSTVGQAPLLSTIDPISRQPPNSVGFFSAPASLPKQKSSLGLEVHPYHITPMPLQQPSLPPAPSLQPHSIDFLSSRGLQPSTLLNEPPRDMSNDISGPMLSLLLKCNDIVNKVKSSLGYLPYKAM